MKRTTKIVRTFAVFASAFFAFSCASTPKENATESAVEQNETQEQDSEKTKNQDAKIDNGVETENPVQQNTSETVQKEPSDFEKFVSLTENLYADSIQIAATPRETSIGKAFAKPYTILVLGADGETVADFPLTVLYPVKRGEDERGRKTDDAIIFEKAQLKTDENGKANFLPPVPKESILSEISVFPTFDENSPDASKIAEESNKFRKNAPFEVRTNRLSAGGLISLVEFRADGSPIRGDSLASSKLLTALMKRRFTGVGNIDLFSSVPSMNSEIVFSDAKKTIGDAGGKIAYLIYGILKPVDDGENAAFNVDVRCMNLSDGSEIYSVEETVSGKTSAEARINAANDLAQKLLYGL